MLYVRHILFSLIIGLSSCATTPQTPHTSWQYKQIFCGLYHEQGKKFFKITTFGKVNTIECTESQMVSYECPKGMQVFIELGPDKKLQPTWLINSDIEAGIMRGNVYMSDMTLTTAPVTLGCYTPE